MGIFDLFGGRNTASRPQNSQTGKPFIVSDTFDMKYQLLMRFAATLFDSDELTVSITAYSRDYESHRAGEIQLTLCSAGSIQWRGKSLLQSDSSSNKGLYNLFYGPAYNGSDAIRYNFREPDCYIFGCPEGPFRQEVAEYCPHAYVAFYRHYPNGMFCATIKFHNIDATEAYDNQKEFERMNKITFGL